MRPIAKRQRFAWRVDAFAVAESQFCALTGETGWTNVVFVLSVPSLAVIVTSAGPDARPLGNTCF